MVVSHEDAQDVLQETFLRIHTHLGELKAAGSERAWVYRIATNESLMWLRNKREQVSLDEDEFSSLLATLHSDAYADTGDGLVVLFQEALLTLPPTQRAVFNLRYYDELPYEEIASVLNISVSSAKTSYHYAKTKISNYVTSHTPH